MTAAMAATSDRWTVGCLFGVYLFLFILLLPIIGRLRPAFSSCNNHKNGRWTHCNVVRCEVACACTDGTRVLPVHTYIHTLHTHIHGYIPGYLFVAIIKKLVMCLNKLSACER